MLCVESHNMGKARDVQSVKTLHTCKNYVANGKEVNDAAACPPLLRLPPELRNRIHGDILGGHTIHLKGSHGDKIWHTICREAISDRDFANSIVRNGLEHDKLRIQNRHQHCAVDRESPRLKQQTLCLDLLLTCQQIHQEAALLPLSLNIISAHGCEDLSSLLDRLTPVQRRAITNLVLHTFQLTPLASLCGSKMTGLRHLTVFTLDVYSNYGFGFAGIRANEKRSRLQSLGVPKGLTLSSARLCVTVCLNPDAGPSPARGKAILEAVRTVSRDIEREFLRLPDVA